MIDYKRRAVEQWTADPCGPAVEAAEGTAEHLDQLVTARLAYAPWLREALDYDSTAGLDVLDVGCGQGIDLALYGRAGAHVAGVDLTPRHVELARTHLNAAGIASRVVVGDAEGLPFGDGMFDRVSSNGVLHHTPDMLRALREIWRTLRPGGQTRIIVYNRASLHYWLWQVLWMGVVHGQLLQEGSMAGVLSRGVERSSIGARPLVRVYSPWALRRLLRAAGFADVSTTVRHFRPEDTPLTAALRNRVRLLQDQRALDWLGSVAGWYLVGSGTRRHDHHQPRLGSFRSR